MKYLFIDESGDHNLDPKKIDPSFPLFVLTGIIFNTVGYRKFKVGLKNLKKKVFGNEKVLLHSLEINRPQKSKQKGIWDLGDIKNRALFYSELNNLISQTKFSIAIFVIRKREIQHQLAKYLPDPYFLCFTYILEIFIDSLKKGERGEIVVEKRGGVLDRQFVLSWESIKLQKGLKAIKPLLVSKSIKYPGLELSDLVSYRLSRDFNAKNPKSGINEIDLRILKKKETRIRSSPL